MPALEVSCRWASRRPGFPRMPHCSVNAPRLRRSPYRCLCAQPHTHSPQYFLNCKTLAITASGPRAGPYAMPRLVFASAIQRHIPSPEREVPAATVCAALEMAFREQPELRGYILDDQGQLRRHLAVFVDGSAIRDRRRMSDRVGASSQIFVVQALSGG